MSDERLDRLEAHLHKVDERLAFLTMRVDTLQAEMVPPWLPVQPVLPVQPTANTKPPSLGAAAAPRPVERPAIAFVPALQPSGPGAESAPDMMARDQLTGPNSKQQSGKMSWMQRLLDPRWPIANPTATGDGASPRGARMGPSASWQELERALSERGLALAGGLALLIGAVLFFSLAITRGWIGPEARVALGLVGGFALAFLGDRLLPTRNRVVGAVLVAVGIGVWQLALVAGARRYEVVPLEAALPGMAAAAAVATALAIRANAQVIALYGLGTALAAPILFGIPDAQIPMPYLTVMVAATAAIALARGWAAPPWLAFVLSIYQFSEWAWPAAAGSKPDTAGFWLAGLVALHGVAALGLELRATPRFRPGSRLLLAADGAVYISFILALYWREAAPWLVAGAVACVLLGVACQRLAPAALAGNQRWFALTAFTLAVVQVTITILLLVDGPAIECLWAVEALILLWLATHFRERAGLVGAALVFGLAAVTAYGRARVTDAGTLPELPFISPALMTLLVFLAVLGLAGVIRHATSDRRVLLACALLLMTVALPLHAAGAGLVVGWAALTVLAVAGDRIMPGSASGQAPAFQRKVDLAVLPSVGALTAVLAMNHAITFEMPLSVSIRLADAAYTGQPVMATVALVAAAAAVAAIAPHARVRQLAMAAGIGAVAWFAVFTLLTPQTVIAWAGLAILAERIRQRLPDGGPILLGLSGVLLALGTTITLLDVAPLRNLTVSSTAPAVAPGDGLLALGALAAATLILAWGVRSYPAGRWLACTAITLLAYAVSLSVVAAFQRNVNPANIADLHRQAQMALSITWAMVDGLLLGAGVVRAQPFLRWYGLGLLGLATAKVFLYDLNSLDALYRVLSFLVLGVVLLASATVYRRLDRPAGVSSR